MIILINNVCYFRQPTQSHSRCIKSQFPLFLVGTGEAASAPHVSFLALAINLQREPKTWGFASFIHVRCLVLFHVAVGVRRIFPGGQQWWNFILSSPTLREKYFPTKSYKQNIKFQNPVGGTIRPCPTFRRPWVWHIRCAQTSTLTFDA